MSGNTGIGLLGGGKASVIGCGTEDQGCFL